MITIDHMHFELVEDYRDAFDEEQFKKKYSEVLNKYDYIVGDIGYEKLRLTGFYRDGKSKVERDKKFSAIQDYLYEYCNFGCAYFVLRKIPKSEMKAGQEADAESPGPGISSDGRDQADSSPEPKKNKTLAAHQPVDGE
ncbi:YutD family protein [Salinicoccus roseus]|uniref:YutD family protein n=1 Tax=Salinicoccus roseus TaxID=45670 RepID=UPI001EF6A9D5|nr:YutD family protein [Salinicoccus roseus]MCG7331709.1 YutD family protein [Salinicoccus roseus]